MRAEDKFRVTHCSAKREELVHGNAVITYDTNATTCAVCKEVHEVKYGRSNVIIEVCLSTGTAFLGCRRYWKDRHIHTRYGFNLPAEWLSVDTQVTNEFDQFLELVPPSKYNIKALPNSKDEDKPTVRYFYDLTKNVVAFFDASREIGFNKNEMTFFQHSETSSEREQRTVSSQPSERRSNVSAAVNASPAGTATAARNVSPAGTAAAAGNAADTPGTSGSRSTKKRKFLFYPKDLD